MIGKHRYKSDETGGDIWQQMLLVFIMNTIMLEMFEFRYVNQGPEKSYWEGDLRCRSSRPSPS